MGVAVKPTPESQIDADYGLVRRAVRILLSPGENSPLPATLERISSACRAVVNEAGKGEGLYDIVKLELERCVGTMGKMLETESRKSVEWLVPFTEACAWYEKQVVSRLPPARLFLLH